jgi:hypothetical protein
MNYEEWNNLEQIKDPDNPFSRCFVYPGGQVFYIESAFYTQLSNFKEMYSIKDFQRIVKKMAEIVMERQKVIFTYDYENPLTHKEGFILLEFGDVADSLRIFIEDKSRGSDYGD